MKLKLKHELGFVEIETDVYDHPDKQVIASVSFQASESEKEQELNKLFYEAAESATGAYGHGFHIDETTNLDLAIASHYLKGFEAISQDPPVIEPNPNFPPFGCCS